MIGIFVVGICFAADGTAWSKNIVEIIQSIIDKIFSLVGGICLLAILIGGVTWITAGGDTKRVDLGKAIVKAALIGLVVVLGAGILVKEVAGLGN